MFDNILHVYSQGMWHDEVVIAGDRKALTKLRDSLNRALKKKITTEMGIFSSSEHMTNDGEGFHCMINLRSSKVLEKIRLPYTDEIARDK